MVQFAGSVSLEKVSCGNAYSDEHIEKVSTDGLHLTFCCGVCMFGGCEIKANQIEFVQYANILLGQEHGKIEMLRVKPEQLCGEKRLYRGLVVAAIWRAGDLTISNQRKVSRTKKRELPVADSSSEL